MTGIPDEFVEKATDAIRKLEREHGVDGLDWTGLDSNVVATSALEAVGLPALLERVEAAEQMFADCEATLADTRGMLDRTEAQVHDDDGFISQVVDQQAEILDLRHRCDALAAKVARVEAVADHPKPSHDPFVLIADIRAALTDGTEE